MKSIPCYLLLVSVCKNAEIYDNLIATVGFYPSRASGKADKTVFVLSNLLSKEIEDERLKRKIISVVRG